MDTATIAEVGGYALLALILIALVPVCERAERRLVGWLIGESDPAQLVRNARGVLTTPEEVNR